MKFSNRSPKFVLSWRKTATTKAVPKIEASGGRVLVQGVEMENENMLHLVMETPDEETVAGFMSDEQFTADRVAAGVHVETTEVTFLKD